MKLGVGGGVSFLFFGVWAFCKVGISPSFNPHFAKDNVFLQELIGDTMTDFMALWKEAESHCWATVIGGKLVHFELIVVDQGSCGSFSMEDKLFKLLTHLASKCSQVISWISAKELAVICIWLVASLVV